MAQHALGNVTNASTTTAVRATTNLPTITPGVLATDRFVCQGLQFQALSTNTGSVYICDNASPNLALDVYVEIPPPAAGPPVTRPGWAIGDPAAKGTFNAADFWILPTVAGEGVRVTAMR